MNVRNALICLLIIFGSLSCELERANFNAKFLPYTKAFEQETGYNLLEPSETHILPETLTEISGLALINDSTLACVEDESGLIFIYSLSRGKMIDQLRFSGPGDYEGIALAGDKVYTLKSSGSLYEYSLRDQSTNTIKTPLKRANNSEGLVYDSLNNRLLIACKGEAGVNGNKIKGKAIYSYSLSTGFNPEPVIVITREKIIEWNEKQPSELRVSNKRMGFMPSALAIHPSSGDLYILANVGKVLIVLSPAGEIQHFVPLSPRVFRQPEGICFTSSGDLIVSNEGQDGSGKIQVFKRTAGLKE